MLVGRRGLLGGHRHRRVVLDHRKLASTSKQHGLWHWRALLNTPTQRGRGLLVLLRWIGVLVMAMLMRWGVMVTMVSPTTLWVPRVFSPANGATRSTNSKANTCLVLVMGRRWWSAAVASLRGVGVGGLAHIAGIVR